MSNEQSPWSQPDPRWQPQSYRDVTGRDPRQPFGPPHGQTPGQQPSIEDFGTRRRGSGNRWLAVVGVVLAIALVVVALQLLGGEPSTPPAAAPSPVPTTSSQTSESPPTAVGGGSSIPFEGNGTGTFELLKETWDETGVDIEFRVTLDSGQEGFTVFLFNNASMEVSDAVLPAEFTVTAGTPYNGSARFQIVRGPGTLVLGNWMGRALTALPVKG